MPSLVGNYVSALILRRKSRQARRLPTNCSHFTAVVIVSGGKIGWQNHVRLAGCLVVIRVSSTSGRVIDSLGGVKANDDSVSLPFPAVTFDDSPQQIALGARQRSAPSGPPPPPVVGEEHPPRANVCPPHLILP